MIVSPESGGEIRRAVGDGGHFGLEVEYIVQDRPAGLAHALATALPWVNGDDVLMYLGDNLVRDGVVKIVEDFEANRPNCQILLTRVEDPSAFGVAELDANGQVVRLVEKPKEPASDLALVGVYLFDQTVGEAVAGIAPSARGELEITDAIQYLVDKGAVVHPSFVEGWWKDTGKKDDLLQANQLVLGDCETEILGDVVDCRIRGAVRIEKGARLADCTITGPVVIGAGASLARTEIGANTAIGNDCHIADSVIEASIVMEKAEVYGWKLRNSLVGRAARLRGTAPDFAEVTIGERSEILIS
jgi:glucose-1-phosphate thymidylyltransferase